MQKLIIAGTVTKPGEVRRTGNGDAVLGFTVVVDNGKDRDGNRRDGTFYECSLWGKRAEGLGAHITKGKKLTLIGRPTARAYEGKAYLGMSVDDLSFQGDAQMRDNSHDEPRHEPRQQSRGDLDDEIPF